MSGRGARLNVSRSGGVIFGRTEPFARVLAVRPSGSTRLGRETLPFRTVMLRTLRALSGLSLLIAVAACSSGPSGPASTPAPASTAPANEEVEPTTADGIFTLAQAERGHELFRSTCSECHEAADWTDAGFKGRWEDESVFQLWYYINDRMPYDDPWSLTRQQVTDVLTYILLLNDLPAGSSELATDDDSIDDYWIAWSPAGSD